MINDLQIQVDKNSTETILSQLINSIQGLISDKELNEGDTLPSINGLSKHFAISRDTVFKAYQQLRANGIVDSTPAKGYFVARKFNRILLVLDYYSPFKDAFHESFIKNIPSDYIVDLVFHHYNKNLFNTVIQNAVGKYSYYVVMNYDTQKFAVSSELEKINPGKLLLLDIPIENWEKVDYEKVSCVFQDFDFSVYNCLVEIKDKIKKYSRLNVIHSDKSNHPGITVKSIEKFCRDMHIRFQHFLNIDEIDVKESEAYIVFRQKDLGKIIKRMREKSLIPGKEAGLIAYNDAPLYEFIDSGITVISANFEEMGQRAAEFVTSSKVIKENIQTHVKIRGTL